jgi:hypothetical protein
MSRGKPFARQFVLCAALVFTTPAAAEMDGQAFLRGYDTGTLETRRLYERILGATENGISWANAKVMHDGQPGIFCPPNNLALADQQNVDILRRYLTAHPNEGTLACGLILLSALRETFPCK